ncbi:hypothetical protein K493DRAFT_40129 [Basidiobolus meristosporus CBS 931.73]|uniref:Mid2 domain-containing protein n=1 Tax=Basidiobolus meristosporus CBS 931.73 TaxID=1314790 RepID=A0A1Y1Y5J1_9FUNG|nr:hypothetical protein K493DRAFT_40129 [Basidiobolus meristosporus CBS 931.73]|eukprot:ORX92874.1 hypothetical protein K493DRAFT_40129 [Basidiobolus meristosporus CBS 931.73]
MKLSVAPTRRSWLIISAFLVLSLICCSSADPVADDAPCSPQLYCSPELNATWTVGSSQILRWNKYYGTLVAKSTVDIYLYEMSDTRKPLKQWMGYNNEGFLPIIVTSDYFQEIPNRAGNVNLIRYYKFVVTTEGGAPTTSESGPIFKIQDNIPTASTQIVTSTVIVTYTPTDLSRPGVNTGSSGVSGKTIGIIVGSILGALAAGALAFFLIRYKTHKNKQSAGAISSEKPDTISPNNNRSIPNAVSGQAPTDSLSSVRRGDSVQSTSPLTAGAGSHGNDSQFVKLTENEAKLIADVYRKSLRKPGWEDGETSNRNSTD